MVNFDSEEFSYDEILERMLTDVPLDIDKREGSVIYNALAPAAAELAQAYIWMSQILELSFADTSSADFLDMRAREVGINRFPASHALYFVVFTFSEGDARVPVGSRFMVDDFYFELIDEGTLRIETPGEPGNNIQEGTDLLPLDTIIGLESVKIGALIQRGSDEEGDESFRERYFVRVRREANSGNRAHYKAWAEEVEGVGMAKVFPLHDGPGTVKIVIVNNNFQPPVQALINSVQNYVDPQHGVGEGQAPIGATVTVAGASIENINITADVVLEINRTVDDAQSELQQSLSRHLSSNSFRLDTLLISRVSELLGACDSVRSYSNVRINGSESNFDINPEKIAVLNSISLEGI